MILSIIIPVYNVEKYIRKTLESIYNQFFPQEEVEVIVVNDGTPDNSMRIVAEFEKIHSNLVIVNQKNKGLSGARNTGMEIARGEYIWFVDSDDWLEPDSMPYILRRLRKANEEVFVFRIKEFDEDGRLLYERHFKKDCEYSLSGLDVLLDTKFDHVPMQIYILKRSFIENNNLRFVEGIQHEDIEFSARMLIKADCVVFSTITSYCYLRRSTGSITAGKYMSKKRIDSYLFIIDEFSEIERNSNNYLVKKAFSQLQRDYILHIYYLVSPQDMQKEGFLKQPYLGKSKRTVMRCIKYRQDLKHIAKDLLFIFSVTLYNKYMTRTYLSN